MILHYDFKWCSIQRNTVRDISKDLLNGKIVGTVNEAPQKKELQSKKAH